ncbi:MAG: hypothetical protein RBU30_17760 [Polyangia bacterium]|jgi:hypothetical protein|nr:hypothetical protein [Polyangia bacterium]
MTVSQLIAQVQAHGGDLALVSGRLRLRGGKQLPEDLQVEARTRAAEIAEWLGADPFQRELHQALDRLSALTDWSTIPEAALAPGREADARLDQVAQRLDLPGGEEYLTEALEELRTWEATWCRVAEGSSW